MFRFDSGDNSLALLKRLFLWYKTLMWKRRLPPSDSCDEVLIWSRGGKLSPTRAHTLVSSRCFQDVERVCRAAAAFCCFRFLHYPLQYCWASLVAQLVKNLPSAWETWVRSLGSKDFLEKGKPIHSCILACRVHGVTKSRID